VQLKARIAGHTWLPVDIIRPAAVIALVKTGDRVKARKVFEALDRYSVLEAGDLRVELLRALVPTPKAVRTDLQ
jgi:hypothetical protein